MVSSVSRPPFYYSDGGGAYFSILILYLGLYPSDIQILNAFTSIALKFIFFCKVGSGICSFSGDVSVADDVTVFQEFWTKGTRGAMRRGIVPRVLASRLRQNPVVVVRGC